MDDRQLRTAWQNRQPAETARLLSEPLTILMKHTLAKRAKQLGTLAKVWDEVLPELSTITSDGTPATAGDFTLSLDGETTAVIAFDAESLVIGGSVETKNLAELLRKMADFVERENGGKRVKESFIDISHA